MVINALGMPDGDALGMSDSALGMSDGDALGKSDYK